MKKQVTLTNVQVFGLNGTLQTIAQLNRQNFKYNLCIMRNIKAIAPIIEAVQAILPTMDGDETKIKELENTEVDVELYTLTEDDMPTDANSQETMLFLNYLMKDE